MDSRLMLNDGTELAGWCLEDDAGLYVYLTGVTLAEAFWALSDGGRTVVIEETRYGVRTTYGGYTHLKALSEDVGGQVSAVLRKGV